MSAKAAALALAPLPPNPKKQQLRALRHGLRAIAEGLLTLGAVVQVLADAEAHQERVSEASADLNLREVAKALKVSDWYVKQRVKKGELAALQLGPRTYRVSPAALEDYRRRRLIRR